MLPCADLSGNRGQQELPVVWSGLQRAAERKLSFSSAQDRMLSNLSLPVLQPSMLSDSVSPLIEHIT